MHILPGPNYMPVERAGHRNYLGEVKRQTTIVNLVLGAKGRSGEQWDILVRWERMAIPNLFGIN